MHEETKPDRSKPASDSAAAPSAARRPYQSPMLIEYGSVAKLTRGSLSVNADMGIGGTRKSPCL